MDRPLEIKEKGKQTTIKTETQSDKIKKGWLSGGRWRRYIHSPTIVAVNNS